MVLDVVDLGLFNGSTAVHCWEYGFVFTPQRLLAIWGPWNGEVSHSHRGQPAVPPRWPWTDRWWGLLLYTSVLALASEPIPPAQVGQVLPPSSRKYCTDINTLAWGCRSSCRGEGGGGGRGGGSMRAGPGPARLRTRPHGWSPKAKGVLAA